MSPRPRLGELMVAGVLGAAAAATFLHPPATAAASIARPGTTPEAPREVPAGYAAPVAVARDRSTEASVGRLSARAAVWMPDDQPPARALEAYQRAATVMERADQTCRLTWPLLAALGSVESDHGRAGGSRLSADGAASPPILGPRLDGRGSSDRIADTDQGRLDGDPTLDRAVGPLQFIPSTWAVVGVDADGDGIRDPQDIDDASLAAAVYLCGWHEDLATEAGRRAAIFRYNRSWSYVARVLQVMHQYAAPLVPEPVTVVTAGVAPATTDEDDAPATQTEADGGGLTWVLVETVPVGPATTGTWGDPPPTVSLPPPPPTTPSSPVWPPGATVAAPSPSTPEWPASQAEPSAEEVAAELPTELSTELPTEPPVVPDPDPAGPGPA